MNKAFDTFSGNISSTSQQVAAIEGAVGNLVSRLWESSTPEGIN